MTPALLTLARRALTGEAKVARGQVVLAAVSGGPDSMALLHVLTRLAPPLGLLVHAHGVDHGLRAEAARELDVAEAFAARLGVAFGRTVVAVGRGGNLQARARLARYAALAEAARAVGAAVIATAHHADDRAETFMMRLMRGAGPRGLAVLPPRAPLPSEPGLELLRPLLRARRSSVRAHVARHQVPFATDPSNADPRFLRARVRHELAPLLEELAPGIVDHLVALADQLGAADGDAPSGFPLPRATQSALADLVRSRSLTARVWLPGGLVATVDERARPAPAAPPESPDDHRSFRPPT
jgi:tRNA(Ile)-lysidine synthase